MRSEWINALVLLCPVELSVLVSDGKAWGVGKRTKTGQWVTHPVMQVVYYRYVELPPAQPYSAPDGALIIPLQGRTPDLDDLVQPGDELWASSITELSRGEDAYLTFLEIKPDAVLYRQTKTKGVFISDWQGIRELLYKLHWKTCYVRRPLTV